MDIPIVFIHKGGGVVFNDAPFNYLNFVTLQARLFNPRSDIVVMSDTPCLGSLLPFHTHAEALESYALVMNEVRGVYKHQSPQSQRQAGAKLEIHP